MIRKHEERGHPNHCADAAVDQDVGCDVSGSIPSARVADYVGHAVDDSFPNQFDDQREQQLAEQPKHLSAGYRNAY